MSLTQLLNDWIGEDEVCHEQCQWLNGECDHVIENRLRAELRQNSSSLLAKIEQHVLEARKDELEVIRQKHDYFAPQYGCSILKRVVTGRLKELMEAQPLDALLNTKGADHEKNPHA